VPGRVAAGIVAMLEDWRDGEDLTVPLAEGERAATLLEHLARTRAALERERAEAPARCAELLALPPDQQLGAVCLDRSLHTWGVCEHLLDLGRADEERDPVESGRLAGLALAAAAQLDPNLHAPAVVEDLKARAWAVAGEARRRTGDMEGAERALRAAAGCIAQGTGDLLVEALLLEFEAAVRHDQGRLGEAGALLGQAASRYREVREPHLLARAQQKREEVLRTPPRLPALAGAASAAFRFSA
jgi:hypothetical protein